MRHGTNKPTNQLAGIFLVAYVGGAYLWTFSMILLGRMWLLTSHQELLKIYAKPADEATDFNINNTNSVKKPYLLTRIARRLVLFLFGYHLSYSKAVEVSEVAGSLMLHSVLASND